MVNAIIYYRQLLVAKTSENHRQDLGGGGEVLSKWKLTILFLFQMLFHLCVFVWGWDGERVSFIPFEQTKD